ncbi:MAG: 3-methyl-2-oxobutanoate hydroxymethyltransferase [Planctomycetaceae bacterium]|nr:3-methyl-2-oxobutanoate hydroxymethyltransferase [Planctomycetaceae bacterium]
MAEQISRMTVPRFMALKDKGRKISMLTAYDFPFAKLLDEAGVDAVLVGDSLSMVVQGHENTLHVTLDEIIYHAEMVGRAVERALVVVDMPFPTFHLGPTAAVAHAARLLKESRCQAVKLEGGVEQAATIATLVSAGIPVMGHVGLRPQTVHQMGGYKVQRDEERLMADARAAEQAGAFAVVLECIPPAIAAKVTGALRIPTIGIGAGNECDGQVLVLHDLVGLTAGYVPNFVRQYADLRTTVRQAVEQYCQDVAACVFPSEGQAAK